ncbi:MAG TPA: IgA Peptidase M64 [Acidobacteriota bacterium]|nr:IgA Peptidase M64 [Acidobacteriota bacterium]
MKVKLFVLLSFVCSLSFATPPTLRLDYSHTGNSKTESFGLDRIVVEPLPWPGNPARAVDDTNLGPYMFEIIDRATNKLLYSRGFASVFNEWQTTAEAGQISRSFQESLRFPMPDKTVQVVIKKRDSSNAFHEIWSIQVDPSDKTIDRSKSTAPAPLLELQKSGDPATKVDFLILGDGYTAAEAPKFEKDAKRLMEILFATSPFKERRSDFNVWGLCPPAAESGISRPSTGVYKHSPVAATYDAFGSERYVLTFDNRSFREIAAFAPYEFVEILANNNTYGGGGIYNQYSTVAADSLWAPYVFVHEFGHHFAALADEYYTSDVAYQPSAQRIEPWEPNVTALLDPASLKWKDLVKPGTPIPTLWGKDAFEQYSRDIQAKRRQIRKENRPESEMDALFKEELNHDTQQLGSEKFAGKVGAFEGANYEAKGYYRPQNDCIMFTRDKVPFCAVCRRAIERIIDLYSR